MPALEDHPLTDEQLALMIADGRSLPEWALKLRIGRRAMIAAAAVNIMERRKAARRQEQREHRRAVRRATPIAAREPCFVCAGFKPITQRHHLRPVASQQPGDPHDTRFVWLCPNCHTIFHAFAAGAEATAEFAGMLTPAQWRVMCRILAATGGAEL